MIQRIQSIYLLLSTVVISIMFFIPFAEGISKEGQSLIFNYNGIGSINTIPENLKLNTLPLIILLTVIFIITIITIFSFKNRTTQIRLSIFCILITIGLIIIEWYYLKQFSVLIEGKTNLKMTVILPVISIILIYLALKAIRRDENLVKSANRIR